MAQLPKYERLNEEAATLAITPSADEDLAADKETKTIIKPPSEPTFETKSQKKSVIANIPELTEKEIREACLNYLDQISCYGSKFVKTMVIREIQKSCVFHYRLETLGEKRETSQKFTPYAGELIDGPENGVPPEPWDIETNIPRNFKTSEHKVEIPHTAFVKPCGKCVATGKIPCSSCSGIGKNRCLSCGGSGKQSAIASCSSCDGDGTKTCKVCHGKGTVKCPRCDGCRRLKWFTMLIVTRINHREDFATDTGNIPVKKILSETGSILFSEEDLKVSPLSHAYDESVNTASSRLITKHSKGFPFETLLRQRHWLRAVPFTKVTYEWKRKTGEFYVYGFENEVHFENYPQTCCGCIFL